MEHPEITVSYAMEQKPYVHLLQTRFTRRV